MEEKRLPDDVIVRIMEIICQEKLKDLPTEDILQRISEILENAGITMAEEDAWQIALEWCPRVFRGLNKQTKKE